MAIELPLLPYQKHELEPHISSETLEYHYGKHHQAYVTNLHKLIDGTEFQNASLEDIIRKRLGKRTLGFGQSSGYKSEHDLAELLPQVTTDDVLQYGLGVSTVWYETLDKAVIPTLELVGASFLNGLTSGPLGPLSVDGDASIAIHPGIRFAWDRGGDVGVTEFGISTGFGLTSERQFDQLLRFELRFSQ